MNEPEAAQVKKYADAASSTPYQDVMPIVLEGVKLVVS